MFINFCNGQNFPIFFQKILQKQNKVLNNLKTDLELPGKHMHENIKYSQGSTQ